MRARKYPNQKVDPVIYSKYYLLLEKTYKLYTDYEKQLLSIQLEQKSHQLEQKDHQIKHQAHQIEHQAQTIEQTGQELKDQKKYVLRLNEMLVDSSAKVDIQLKKFTC